ncbi:MAG: type 4a pilus biogenesis protein PilO [Candidatus Cloacimonas sp.]
MRNKYLIFVLCILLITILFFVFTINNVNANRSKIKELDSKIKTAQEQLNSARIMNQQLSQFSMIIDNSLTREPSFSFDEINAFKTTIGKMADQRNIAINKLSDSNKFTLQGLVETTYTMELEASYVQIGQFISDLESMDNIIKIHSLDISPLAASEKDVAAENGPNRYRVSLELSVFKVKREA